MQIKNIKPAYIVLEKRANGRIGITWRFTTQVKKNAEGVWDCSIPEFEIYFNVDSKEELDAKSITFTKMFFDYHLKENKMDLRSLATNLIRLGFKPSNGIADVAKLTRNKFVPTKFSSPKFNHLEGFEKVEMEGELVA